MCFADLTAFSFTHCFMHSADGVRSATRRLYSQHDPSFSSRVEPSEQAYVSFSGLHMPGWRVQLSCGGCVQAQR